ncbi:MAG TPA: phosphopantetheine-binding protein [Micromonosporaceae bacterium]
MPAPAGDRPPGELVAMLAEVWRTVLNLDTVDPDRTFFALGGNSLTLLRVHQLLRERLGRELSLVDLFRYPTLRQLAAALAGGTEEGTRPATSRGRGEQGTRLDRIRAARQRARAQARQTLEEPG